jgi:hypothetical protein
MATAILSGILGLFAQSAKNQPSTPAAFRSSRRPVIVAPPPPPPHEAQKFTRWLLVEFSTSADSKRFKKVVQDVLTNTIEGCSALTAAHQKSNGRAVIVSFTSAHYSRAADSAFDHFKTSLEVFAMNAGGLAFDTEDSAKRRSSWRDCSWFEVATPAHANGAIVGYVLCHGIGMQLVQ